MALLVNPVRLLTLLLLACPIALGQTPSPASGTDATRQQDATRPPATQQRAPVAAPTRSVTTDPTAPAGLNRPATQGTTAPGLGLPQSTPSVTTPTLQDSPAGAQEDTAPSFDSLREARSLPPLPSLKRLSATDDKTITLTLNEAIRRALENNNDIDVARNDVRFSETVLRAAEAIYDPLISFTPQIDYRVEPLLSSFDGTGRSSFRTTDINFNQAVTKLFRTGGGQYQFFFNNTRASSTSGSSPVNPFYSASLGVQFTQPLLRNRAIDLNRRTIRVQRKQLAQSDADFRRRVMDTIVQVQRAYWDLVFALRDQQNRIANLKLARELFRQTEQRIAAGAIAPLERAEVQTELASRENEVIEATENVSITENTLKQLMLRDSSSAEWSAALVPTDEPSFEDTHISLTSALAEGRANRPELSRLRLQQEINDIDVEYFNNQARPRVDIQAALATTGLAGSLAGAGGAGNTNSPLGTPGQFQGQVAQGNLGGYGRMLRNLFSLQTHNVVVGLTIELPFRNRRAQAELAGARIRREQLDSTLRAQEQAIETEIRNAAQSLESSRQRVLTARIARQNAELQLLGERRLYEVGQSTTFLLFQRENRLTFARNLELRSQTDYNKALANLQRATSVTLRANSVIVETQVGQ